MDIEELFDKRGIEYKKTNNPHEILVNCTSGEHQDKSPSLSINLEKGLFNCWSCGFKGGITKFLQSIGEAPVIDIESKQTYKIIKLRNKLKEHLDISDFKLPEDRRVFRETYRGIKPETFAFFNAFTTSSLGLEDYLCIPVYQHGKLRFIEGRLLKDLPNQPKYYRRPDKAKVKDVLFPLDKIQNTNHVILVEGIYDAINMWQLGYTNTLCIFGSNNFNKTKLDLLDNRGVTRVDILLDSDISGKRASAKIMDTLDSRNIYPRNIPLPPGVDPGELTKELADKLLKL